MATATDGIRPETLVPWLEAHVDGLRAPLDFELIAGGRSNYTYLVTDADHRRFVLRRPPVKQVLATAHDMGREHRIIRALGPTDVPVPTALAFCDDGDVNGAAFYVMDFVDGHIVRDRDTAEKALSTEARRAASESLIRTLAAIHTVDVDAVGLGDLGRREGYIARQLKRWRGQLDHATSEVPAALFEVHQRLGRAIPEQRHDGIVHGDFRLDNCVVGDDGDVRAVLDWELCTLGDPLADLGMLLVYWTDPDDEDIEEIVVGRPTLAPGFLTRRALVDRYGGLTGRDLSDLDFYVAFAHWRIGCILQGVLDRYRDGAMADDGTDVEGLRERVARAGIAAGDILGS